VKAEGFKAKVVKAFKEAFPSRLAVKNAATDLARQHYPIELQDIAIFVTLELVEELGVEVKQLLPAARFAEDLGCDLGDEDVTTAIRLREQLGVPVPIEAVSAAKTVGQLVDYVRSCTQRVEFHKSLAIVALGSNLGDSNQIARDVIDRSRQLSDAPLLKSSLWQSTPVNCPPGSPMFVNAVVALKPRAGETPESLLEKLQALEGEFGRQPKTVLNEPRPLDLDLIAFGSEVRATARFALPHPRAHQRRFVLQPLGEIVPQLVLPGQTKTVEQLLDGLVSDEVLSQIPTC